MKAIVYHGTGDVRHEEVPRSTIQEPTDAIVRLTASAICGTDLHFVRGTMSGMKEGRILGHEGVGVVQEFGDRVRDLKVGDRVVIPSTIACGTCSYCRAGCYSQCDNANPNGSGTAFFGGPVDAGGFDGLQAEHARIPYANVGLVMLPDDVTDDQAILLSDIFPSATWRRTSRRSATVTRFACSDAGRLASSRSGVPCTSGGDASSRWIRFRTASRSPATRASRPWTSVGRIRSRWSGDDPGDRGRRRRRQPGSGATTPRPAAGSGDPVRVRPKLSVGPPRSWPRPEPSA